MTDRETLILDQEGTIWLALKLFNLSVTYPHFPHSLVILAVPNGPVYELVLKGSALPKEDDKYDLTFFFYLLPFFIFVNYLISVRFFNRCNGWTKISLLLTYGFIAQYIVVHNHYLSKFGFSHSGFCSYNFFNYSSPLKVTSIILCKHPQFEL